MHLRDLSGLPGVREGLEDLDVGVVVVADLHLHHVVGAGDHLLLDGHWVEVGELSARFLLNVGLQTCDHVVLLLCKGRIGVPTSCEHFLYSSLKYYYIY